MTKLLPLAVTLLAVRDALAFGPYQVQSGTIANVPGLTQGAPYSAEIFYPADAVDVATNTSEPSAHGAAGGKYPLVSFAHGTGGKLSAYQTDMKMVASYGFIVIATESCPATECFSAFSHDQLACVDAAKSKGASLHPALAAADFSKVGVYGHSMGAMATMASAAKASQYSIAAAVAQHPCRDPGTVAASINIPIMYTAASADTICAASFSEGFYTGTPGCKVLWELQGSSHFEPNDGLGKMRELEPSALFLACEIRGEHCDKVYGPGGKAICSAQGLQTCKVDASCANKHRGGLGHPNDNCDYVCSKQSGYGPPAACPESYTCSACCFGKRSASACPIGEKFGPGGCECVCQK